MNTFTKLSQILLRFHTNPLKANWNSSFSILCLAFLTKMTETRDQDICFFLLNCLLCATEQIPNFYSSLNQSLHSSVLPTADWLKHKHSRLEFPSYLLTILWRWNDKKQSRRSRLYDFPTFKILEASPELVWINYFSYL